MDGGKKQQYKTMENLLPIRKVQNYTLVKKGKQYYIDNGVDDVSEYFDEYDAEKFTGISDSEFIELAKQYV